MKINAIKMEKSCGAVVYREAEGMPQVLVIRHKNGGRKNAAAAY